jgi:hypothetical protein
MHCAIYPAYHTVSGISGEVVGIKFSNQKNSMDPSDKGRVNGITLGRVIGKKVAEMVAPDLDSIAVLGFYLLTDGLADRGARAVLIKQRMYGAQARNIHNSLKHKLPVLQMLQASGGIGWTMSKEDFSSHRQYELFEQELRKQLEIL